MLWRFLYYGGFLYPTVLHLTLLGATGAGGDHLALGTLLDDGTILGLLPGIGDTSKTNPLILLILLFYRGAPSSTSYFCDEVWLHGVLLF